jgi:4-hydroxy-tetrahydrodipicolinate reductase
MEKKQMNVLLYGLGPIGIQILQNCLEAEHVNVIGAIDIDPNKVGKDVGSLAGKERVEIEVVSSLTEVDSIKVEGKKIALHATGSDVERMEPQFEALLQAGYSVVSTCEQLSYPWHRHPKTAARIDQLARKKDLTVIGTGINPGFIMDSLTVFATTVTHEITGIYVSRKVDVSKRRLPLQEKVGTGMTPEAFLELAKQGRIGHVGLEESLRLIAYGLNLSLKDVQNSTLPTIATKDTVVALGPLQKGQVSGMHQVSTATTEEGIPIELDLVMSIEIEQEDRIRIVMEEGNDLELVIPGGIFGDTATANVMLNTAKTINASMNTGLLTMADIPLVRNVNYGVRPCVSTVQE